MAGVSAGRNGGSEKAMRPACGATPYLGDPKDVQFTHAALVLRWRNMILRASSSISALNVNLSFSAIARAAAGLADTSSPRRLTFGYFVNTSSPRTNGARRAQPHNAMSTMV